MATHMDLIKAFEYIRDVSKAPAIHYAIDDHSYMCGLNDAPMRNMVFRLYPKQGDIQVLTYGKNAYEIKNGKYGSIYVLTINGDPDMDELPDDELHIVSDIENMFYGKKPKKTTTISSSLQGHKTCVPKVNFRAML